MGSMSGIRLKDSTPLIIIKDSFSNREERTRFLANKFGKYLTGEILDVGCDKAPLKDIVKNIKYTGIDISGNPTVKVDLEKIDRLPFVDREFDVVVCCDVLEHVDNLHHIFSEIIRVAKKTIIISLPNNWTNARRPIEKGRGTFAFYGLPAQKPPDRHKWFFGLSEALEFFHAQQGVHPIKLVECVVNEKKRNFTVTAVRKLLYPKICYLNRYAHTIWAVYQRRDI